jgi:hypothetical protein
MNHIATTTIALALLVAAATPALAEGNGSRATPEVEITATRSAMNGPQIVDAVNDLDTVYEMSNGRRLAVTSYGESLQVRYARRAAISLKHDGSGNFVSGDGRLSLQFGFDGSGRPDLVSLTMPATWL